MIVIDASVAVKWLVREPNHELALDVVDLPWERIAPDLLLPEVTNVLRKKLKNNEITSGQVTAGLLAIETAISRFVPSSELASDAVILSGELDHSAYDCYYLACALGKGILVTADKRFVNKCVSTGYGEFVQLLDDLDSDALGVRIAVSSVGRETIDAIERLSAKMELTFKSLEEASSGGQQGRFRIISAMSVAPAFESPAYLRLAKQLEALGVEELGVIVALGWLGRRYYHASEFSGLLRNARSMAERGFAAHHRYFMAQMSNVSAGLAKLKAYLNGQPDI